MAIGIVAKKPDHVKALAKKFSSPIFIGEFLVQFHTIPRAFVSEKTETSPLVAFMVHSEGKTFCLNFTAGAELFTFVIHFRAGHM